MHLSQNDTKLPPAQVSGGICGVPGRGTGVVGGRGSFSYWGASCCHLLFPPLLHLASCSSCGPLWDHECLHLVEGWVLCRDSAVGHE